MVDFIIEFEILAIMADINKLHAIFLLKKNVQADIIKMVLEYPPMAASEILKEWKIAITLVSQEYKSTKGRQDYKTGIETTYGERGLPMNIGKAKDNFDKKRRSKYFNCKAYRHIVKDCRKPKKKQDTRKYYKCKKIRHIV